MHVIFLMFGVTALLLNPRLEISAIYLDPDVINIGLLGAQVFLLLLLLWISIGKSKQLIKQAAEEAELKLKAKGLGIGLIKSKSKLETAILFQNSGQPIVYY